MIVDLTGQAITELLAAPGVTTIVAQKVRSEFAAGEGPPAVIIRQLGIDYRPIRGVPRARLQSQILAALCYGGTRVQASQLGNAVVEAVELRGIRVDTAGRLIFLSLVEGGGDVELDPVTKWPYATVTFSLLGAQRAVAVA